MKYYLENYKAEENKMVDKLNWYKEITLYNLTVSTTLTYSKEEAEIFNCFLQICQYYGKVTPGSIENNFGLNSALTRKILDLLTDEIQILKKEEGEGGPTYLIRKGFQKFKDDLKVEKFYFQAPTRFFICLFPALLTDKHLYWEKIGNLEPPEGLIEKVEEINQIIKKNSYEKHELKIPDKFCGFNLSKGIFLNGKTICTLHSRENHFLLYRNTFQIAHISNNHPDYSALVEELDLLVKNPEELKKRIREELSLKLQFTDFSIGTTEECQEIDIIIQEHDLEKVGEIYQIITNYEGTEVSIPIEKSWFYKNTLHFTINDSLLNNWITLFKKLNILFQKNYLTMINRDISDILPKIDKIIDEINAMNKDLKFKPSAEKVKNYLLIVANYSQNDWFHMLYAKFLEKEVFA